MRDLFSSSTYLLKTMLPRSKHQFGKQDEEFLQGVPDVVLHHSLRSYFVRGALVETELYDHMEQAAGPSPVPEPSRRPSKDHVGTSEGAEEQAVVPPEPSAGKAGMEQKGSFEWPFSHRISELNPRF
ncbi:uncharacterized protein A4U43_C10F6170 [Asparagus officinalis]|uniref:Uncharacterized protein n=1 Tax=Asparagus officinalis TaxID=4686 RepID=A0A5P1E473_ASPOF|nr:uncharacterized protein A4U43_C10F6170 [Asparagus officinalis]